MKICTTTGTYTAHYGIKEGYRVIREAGFEGIDWSLDNAWNYHQVITAEKLENLSIFEKSQEEIAKYYAEELAAIRENGLEICQVHAPFEGFCYGRPEVSEYAISIYKNMIPFLDGLGARNLIIHGMTKNEKMVDLTYEDTVRINLHMYESLIPELQKAKHLRVCLENLPTDNFLLGRSFWEGCCTDPHVAAEWVDYLNGKAGKECFGICLDTGHLNVIRKPFYTYVPILGKRIFALHLHDNMQNSDSHLIPYMGGVKWNDLLEQLKAVGYEGDISFEIGAHVRPDRIPEALIPNFLGVVREIGAYFRDQIQAIGGETK
jgi:sugar phosphate isomerase/epimerase